MKSAIAYILHADIDKVRWNQLIVDSSNGVAYAHTDFLDAMSPGWDALIAGNYEAVMPLTWRKKFGIRYLCQPAFCQQLGVFSLAPIKAPLVEAFLRKVVQHFRLIEIFLNETNAAEGNQNTLTNYVLNLNPDYQVIKEAYRKDLQKNLARTQKFSFKYQQSDNVREAVEHYQSLYGQWLGYRPQDFNALLAVCEKWINEDRCMVREVYLDEGKRHELLAIGLFLKDKNRIYNIASSTLPNGRTLEANHFLFDQLIQEFSGLNILLDFEGSDLPGVAKFYQKFSPVNRPYFFWKHNRLPAVMRWWKR